ncbi:hypothetical protein CC86DRAFT_375429 [Ophiobolus disseminans]|uniref:Uncharacterized protein n=1 Tax=Ophiobolus disseminans TaxID=1469910 RepID=A0A6A6ZFE0_9PLEO|nr:hypothetical protein CC86DRAFT_375429 [Ophiobolus disseminans]
MGTKPDPRDLLQDLHQLSEAGRERFLALLSQESTTEIPKVALLEWDAAQKERILKDDALSGPK